MLALARHGEADLLQRLHDTRPVVDGPGHHALGQIRGQSVAGVFGHGQALAQRGRRPVGRIARLHIALEGRIVWPAPAVQGVLPVAERVEIPLPARRGDVEALAGFQIDPSGEDMDVDGAVWTVMLHGRPCITVGCQARLGRLLERVQNGHNLGRRRPIGGPPGQHP